MGDQLHIAGYCRISVDDELDRDNTSIENQKAIIADYVSKKFPAADLDFYEDRDRSGYTFEQREGYQVLRRKMMRHEYDILIIKDFSRFSRRNSKGLVELEDLRDVGMRIISIGDSIDYPTFDDWTAIQFRFLINEMPVTDTSKKVRSVVKRRQEEGRWICAVPYGYIMTNSKTMQFEIDEPAAEVVREIFRLYSEGWGYKRIANYLTDQHIPTPRMAEKERREAQGEECTLRGKPEWSLVTVSEILRNDFYIGTLRQGKYRRKKINGSDMKLQETDHLVFEDNHTPIVDYKLFAGVQEQIAQRTRSNYRGVKKYDNVYSGYLFCGDCGSPMFSMSRADLAPAYRCGTYHRRGSKACSSHHTRVDMLDGLLKAFIQKVKENSETMLEKLQESIDRERNETSSSKSVVEVLNQQIEDTRAEIKMLARQHVRDIAKHPEMHKMKPNTDTLNEKNQPNDWLVMYSNTGDVSILDDLETAKNEAGKTGVWDYFVPLDVTRIILEDKPIERKRLIAGSYIFIKATKEDILKLREGPPFDAVLRFLHPASSRTDCIYVTEEEVQMMRLAVDRLDGEVEYFVPSSKDLMVGDIVCITDGPFAGIKGVLESVKGHEGAL